MEGRTVVVPPGPCSLPRLSLPRAHVMRLPISVAAVDDGLHAAGQLNAACVPAEAGASVVVSKGVADNSALATQAGAPAAFTAHVYTGRLVCEVRFTSRCRCAAPPF